MNSSDNIYNKKLNDKGSLLYLIFMIAVYLIGAIIFYFFTAPLVINDIKGFYKTSEITAPAYRNEDCGFFDTKCTYFGQLDIEYGEYNFTYEKNHIGFNPKEITVGFEGENTFRYIPIFNSKISIIIIAVLAPLIYIIVALITYRKFKQYLFKNHLIEKSHEINEVSNNNEGDSNEKNI